MDQNVLILFHWLLLPCTGPPALRLALKEYRSMIDNQTGCSVLLTLAELCKDVRFQPFLASGRNVTSSSAES